MSEEDVPSARRLAEEFMAGYTPGRDAPWIVEEAFQWLQERSIEPIAAYNPNERLTSRVAELEGHFRALDRIVSESIVVNDQPDRVRWEGVWYDGPLATAFLSMMRAVRKLARSALSPLPQGED